METILINSDVKVFYVTAKSFPDGVLDAHQKLHSLIPFSNERKYYGISRPENGKIVYRAAAQEIETGEATRLKCATLTLPAGNYVFKTVKGFMRNPKIIGEVFTELLQTPDLDPEGYCVEHYLDDDVVQCMIRLDG